MINKFVIIFIKNKEFFYRTVNKKLNYTDSITLILSLVNLYHLNIYKTYNYLGNI